MENIDKILYSLSKSKFRSSFHLKEKDKEYIKDKGMDKIREHAKDFITKRLAPKVINNDGKQTPYKGHPVFISQHATATCCRSCLYKWHKIDMNKTLSEEEIDYIVNVIMKWIENENKKIWWILLIMIYYQTNRGGGYMRIISMSQKRFKSLKPLDLPDNIIHPSLQVLQFQK